MSTTLALFLSSPDQPAETQDTQPRTENVRRAPPHRRSVTLGLRRQNALSHGQVGLDTVAQGFATRRHLPVLYSQCFAHRAMCPTCAGTGSVQENEACSTCEGTGRYFARYDEADQLYFDERAAAELGVTSRQGAELAGLRLGPCLYVSCRSNTFLDINEHGNPVLNHGAIEPGDVVGMSCILDVSEEMSLDQAGAVLGITRQAALAIEVVAIAKVQEASGLIQDFVAWDPDDPPSLERAARTGLVNIFPDLDEDADGEKESES